MQKLMERLDRQDELLLAMKAEERQPALTESIRLFDNQDLCMLLQISKRTLQRYRSVGALPYKTLGKKTLVIHIGKKNAERSYCALGNLGIITIIGVTIYDVFQHEASSMFLPFAALYIVLHNRTYMEMKKIGEGRELNRILGKTALNIFCFGIVSSLIIIGMAN